MQLNEQSIVIGCNYHTKWQIKKAMRFILSEIRGNEALLTTRTTRRAFWTKKSDLIFIMSKHNISKAKKIINNQLNQPV